MSDSDTPGKAAAMRAQDMRALSPMDGRWLYATAWLSTPAVRALAAATACMEAVKDRRRPLS
jgi:hypothetical protein